MDERHFDISQTFYLICRIIPVFMAKFDHQYSLVVQFSSSIQDPCVCETVYKLLSHGPKRKNFSFIYSHMFDS